MNYKIFAIFIGIFALLFTLNAVNATTNNLLDGGIRPCLILGNCPEAKPILTVTLDEDKFYIDNTDEIDVEFTIKNTGNATGYVKIQVDQSDSDFEDYFEVDPTSKIIEVEPNEERTITFNVKVDDLSDDYYYLEFNVLKYYESNGKNVELGTETKKVKLSLEDNEDFDVKLDNDVICYNEGLPVERHLIFSNDSSKDYYIRPHVESNNDLWPVVDSDKIEVENDESVKVKIEFKKEAPVGEYELKIDQKLTETLNEDNYIRFKETIPVYVKNCDSYYSNFYINPSTQNMKTNDKVTFNFNYYNNTDNDLLVNFEGYSNDSSVAVAFSQDAVSINSGYNYSGKFTVLTSDNTTPGQKTITLKATSNYSTIERTVYVNVTKGNLSVTANSVEVPVGLKGRQAITLSNNTNSEMLLNLYPKTDNSDLVIIKDYSVIIPANSSKTVYADIYSKTLGNKSYTLSITGNVTLDKVINYTSNSDVGVINYVTTYLKKATAINGVWNTLPVVLENNYNFPVTLTIKLLPTDEITSKTSTINLDPQQKRTVNLQYIVNSNSKNIRATLEVASDVSKNDYPVYLSVKPDTSLTDVLEIVNAPNTIGFVKGRETSTTFKIKNNNDFEINNANVKLLDSENNVLGTAIFNILPNEEKDIEVKFILDSEDTTGSILVSGNDAENYYDIVYVKETSFFKAGLFNLGVGNTISIIIGVLIVLALVLYFALRKPVQEVQ